MALIPSTIAWCQRCGRASSAIPSSTCTFHQREASVQGLLAEAPDQLLQVPAELGQRVQPDVTLELEVGIIDPARRLQPDGQGADDLAEARQQVQAIIDMSAQSVDGEASAVGIRPHDEKGGGGARRKRGARGREVEHVVRAQAIG